MGEVALVELEGEPRDIRTTFLPSERDSHPDLSNLIPPKDFRETLKHYPLNPEICDQITDILNGQSTHNLVCSLLPGEDPKLQRLISILLQHSRKITRFPFTQNIDSEKRNNDETHAITVAAIVREKLAGIFEQPLQGAPIDILGKTKWSPLSSGLPIAIGLTHDAPGESLGETGHNSANQQEIYESSKHDFEEEVAKLAIMAVLVADDEAQKALGKGKDSDQDVSQQEIVNLGLRMFSWFINLVRVPSFVENIETELKDVVGRLWFTYEDLMPDMTRSGEEQSRILINRQELLNQDQLLKKIREFNNKHWNKFINPKEKSPHFNHARALYGMYLIEGGKINEFCVLFPDLNYLVADRRMFAFVSLMIKTIDHAEGSFFMRGMIGEVDNLQKIGKSEDEQKNLNDKRRELNISGRDLDALRKIVDEFRHPEDSGHDEDEKELKICKTLVVFALDAMILSCANNNWHDLRGKYEGLKQEFNNINSLYSKEAKVILDKFDVATLYSTKE